MPVINFLQITQAFPLKFKDPLLKLISRRSWVEKPKNYAQIQRYGGAQTENLTIYFPALDTQEKKYHNRSLS